jgi:uncharacterized membrane protein
MGIAIVWLVLGLFWWSVIVGSLVLFGSLFDGKRRRVAVASLALVELGLVWASSLIPTVGMWIYIPTLFVAMLPFVVVRDLF